jgi:hypothetical protein
VPSSRQPDEPLPAAEPISTAPPPESSRRGVIRTLAIAVIGLVLPLLWHPAMAMLSRNPVEPSYLPALESSRERIAFRPRPIEDLRYLQPGYVFIGDSMLGTRIEPAYLQGLTGEHVAFLARAGTGSAYWYLAFKNYLIASGVKPKVVFFFFRDLNMTDPLFRLTGPFRWSIDEVAHETEPALNDVIASRTRGPWFRVHQAANATYNVNRANAWVERQLYDWPARLWTESDEQRRAWLDALNFDVMGIDKLRPMDDADIAAAVDAEADFGANMPRSVLPLIIDLAKRHDIMVGFVRVQRRPINNRPPEQSPRLQQYMRDFKAYVEAQGMLFHDDTGDPQQTLAMYEDGDHVAREHRQRYTRIFWVHMNRMLR